MKMCVKVCISGLSLSHECVNVGDALVERGSSSIHSGPTAEEIQV